MAFAFPNINVTQPVAQPSNLSATEQAEFERRMKEAEIKLKEQQAAIEAAKAPDAKEQAALNRARVERTKDLNEGQSRGKQLFGDGSMGRYSSAVGNAVSGIANTRLSDTYANQVKALQNNSSYSPELMARINAESQGYTPEELSAMRDQNISTINSNSTANLRALRGSQAANGVRGAQAVAQEGKLRNDQQSMLAQNERDLFLKNIEARRTGTSNLQNAQQYNTGQQRASLADQGTMENTNNAYKEKGLSTLQDYEKFNMDMKNREKQAQITTELGYGALGSADRGAVMQMLVGKEQAANAGGGGGGGKK